MSYRFIRMPFGIVLGALVVVGTLSWPLAWLGLELNLICFVASMFNSESRQKPCIIYFVAQRIGSLMILFMGLVREFTSTAHLVLLFRLVVKLGMLPLHF